MHRSRTPEDFQEEIDFLRNQLDTVIVNHRVDWLTARAYVLAEPHDADWYRRYYDDPATAWDLTTSQIQRFEAIRTASGSLSA